MTLALQEFSADWDSLIAGFQCPDWFRDAKFGVWSHWGPQSLPCQGDWYARYMYVEGHPIYNYHCRTYGHPSKVGFKDICQQWTADKFDAEALVDLYKANGAKYIMGQAAHCDNFDLWNSKHHKWNAVNYGPKQDILGAWSRAAKNAGLPFGFSEHLAWSYSWFNVNKGCDSSGPYAGVPYDGNDPAYQDFYFEPHDDTAGQYPLNPSEAFVNSWKNRMIDAIDQLEPDIMYTDGGLPFGKTGLEVMAYFYNRSLERNDGELLGVYTYKDVLGRRPGSNLNIGEFRPGAGVEDLEKGVLGHIMEEPWQTDTSSGPWYYNMNDRYKTPQEIVHMLVDIVSKNGNLLLNYTQRPDGSLDEVTTWTVKEVGNWLATNGEGIYGTRPWKTYGEGPVRFQEGEMKEDLDSEFTPKDFRFTRKDNHVYAFGFAPGNGEWCIQALGDEKVRNVSLLGSKDSITWHNDPGGLKVTLPKNLAGHSAWTLKVELED
ncbi:alpha-L-fucosidase [Rubellicoccus peritrichatus]|uniref:alpha-L-fucosidase n=1 Tax=Rubellicoccus peritrichatus TaxID=3080537 RepID=A0AAQ3QX67_9BACT|nr:alpha-L-fucosidase [Puniceicoccus sp. CR14]WOO42707.1 alpha-L-fucosidase [Puniceicoccus sp. CR14]